MARVTRRRLLAGAAAAAGLAAVGAPFVLRRGLKRQESFLLVVADAMRGDNIGRVVNGIEVTPNLNRLAGEGLDFRAAFSACSWTKPSMASILCGQYPPYHGVETGARTLPAIETLQSFLKGRGFATLAIQTNPWLKPEVGEPGKPADYGFGAGFDARILKKVPRISDRKSTLRCAYAYGREVCETFRNVIVPFRRDGRPFFGYVHLMDTHPPYLQERPTEFTGRFHEKGLAAGKGREDVYKLDLAVIRKLIFDEQAPGGDDLAALSAAKDEATAYLDAELGRLFAWMRETGLYEDTTIVFTSDHGGELGEHGAIGHGKNLFNTSLHVPLIIKRRGMAPARSNARVTNASILPTVREWLGAPGGRETIAPLCDAQGTPAGSHAAVYASFEGRGKVTLPDGRTFVDGEAGGAFFDVESDPGEKSPLPRDEGTVAELRKLESFLRQTAAGDGVAYRDTTFFWQLALSKGKIEETLKKGVENIPKPLAAQLRALGYLH